MPVTAKTDYHSPSGFSTGAESMGWGAHELTIKILLGEDWSQYMEGGWEGGLKRC